MYVQGGCLIRVHGINVWNNTSMRGHFFFMIFIYLVFLTAEKIPGPTKMDMSIWDSNREGAYNKLHTVTIEL